MAANERTRLTYLYERLRAPAYGVLEAADKTFLLLIAVRYFQCGAVAKAVIGGGAAFGWLCGPMLVSFVQARQWPAARAASRVAMLGAGLFVVAAWFPVQPVFVACSVLGLACASGMMPLMTQVYHENYPERARGRFFSRTVIIRIAATGIFSYFAGEVLSRHVDHFRWLLMVFAGAFAASAWCLHRCPSRALVHPGGTHPFRSLRYVREDALFRRTLVAWMLLGFGNLMMVPLRVEYLANPAHGWTVNGLPLTAVMVALFTGVIPNAARLVLNPLWGWLFDRLNFFVLRMTLNVCFMLSILTFFLSGSMTGLVLGAALYGVSMAGGEIAWSLWVTKFAPQERVADYMSVHTFFTGARGVVAPLVAFQLLTVMPVGAIAGIGAALILVATFALVPELHRGRGRPSAAALTEEVTD